MKLAGIILMIKIKRVQNQDLNQRINLEIINSLKIEKHQRSTLISQISKQIIKIKTFLSYIMLQGLNQLIMLPENKRNKSIFNKFNKKLINQ